MSYIKRKGNGLMGFGDASSCGPDQIYAADYEYNGVKGQCLSAAQYKAWQDQKAAQGGGGSSIWDSLIKGATEVLKGKLTPPPVTNISTSTGGLSTGAKLAIGGGILLAGFAIYKARK